MVVVVENYDAVANLTKLVFFFFQAEDGIRDNWRDWSSDVCSSDLREAGIERADAFAAVTSGDNSNFIAATVARDTFRVPVVIARIYDPQREQIYRRLGIRTISSTAWGAHKIKRMLLNSDLHGSEELGNGEVQVMQARVTGPIAGRPVRDLLYSGSINVFAVVRAGRAFVPTQGT